MFTCVWASPSGDRYHTWENSGDNVFCKGEPEAGRPLSAWHASCACTHARRSDVTGRPAAVGEYLVMESAFPTYNGPEIHNSSSSNPVPKGAIPSPAKTENPNYACINYVSNTIEGVGPSVVPGGLGVDPSSGNYVCAAARSSVSLRTCPPPPRPLARPQRLIPGVWYRSAD